jgi:hypothetical protein
MDLQSLITKLQEIESGATLSEAAPTEFKPTHFHKNNFGGRTSLMLHSDGNFYHMKQGQYPNQGRQEIAKWNFAKFDPEDRSAVNPTSIDGEFVNGKPVDYPEGVTWKTFNQEKQEPGTMDTLPTDDQKKTSNYTGVDQKSPEPEPTQGQNTDIGINLPPGKKEQDELAKDIATAIKLLDKAEGKNAAPVTIESISRKLVESFGYVFEALKDLSPEEQKQLTDVMSKLGPMKDQRPDVKTLVDRYMALQKGAEATPAPTPEKPAEPEKPTGQAEQPAGEDPLMTPEELKTAVARFKELLDKSLMKEPSGQNPQPDPKKRIVPDQKIVPDPKKSEPEPEYTDPYGTDDAAMIMKYAGTARK